MSPKAAKGTSSSADVLALHWASVPPAPASQSLLLPFPLAQPVLALELPPPSWEELLVFKFFTLLDLGTELGLGVSAPVLPVLPVP